MTVGIMQPYLFPYIGYFQLIHAVDQFVIYDDVNHIVRGWINRNNILVNGEKQLFSISLLGASSNKRINEIDILDDFEKFEKTMALAYAKAPHKEQVLALIADICSYPGRNLAQFIGNSLKKITDYLGIETEFLYSSSLKKDNSLRGQDKIIAICKERRASTYINAIGGMELYDKAAFETSGIELKFIKSLPITYKQFDNEFVPNLSIIDVMMFNSPEEIRTMLANYELI